MDFLHSGAVISPNFSRNLLYNDRNQEPMTRSEQQPDIPVTAFSQTDLFLIEFPAKETPAGAR